MNFIYASHTTEEGAEAQQWLRRALTNAKTARILVEEGDLELRVEAVTQVQQACEKAVKAILRAHGMPYSEVTEMGHNAIGSYVNLMSRMLESTASAEEISRVLLTGDATEAATNLAKLVLSGRRNKQKRDRAILAFKQVLPLANQGLGNKALEVNQWQRLTRAFSPAVVEMFIDFYERFSNAGYQYVNNTPNTYADPRPLLNQEISPETWVFDPAHAGLNRQFPGQGTNFPENPIIAKLAQQLLTDNLDRLLALADPQHWPDKISIENVLIRIMNWLTALSWLFICAIVTTPHAVSSRYPAEMHTAQGVIGSQDYDRKLGVVAHIGPLADHTETAIRNLITHFREIGEGYQDIFR